MKKIVIDREKFKRFFFFGIIDQRDVIERILLCSFNKIYKRHVEDDCREIPNKHLESEIIQEAIGPYRQFCRFVILNDKKIIEGMQADQIEGSDEEFPDISKEDLKNQLQEEIQRLKKMGSIIENKFGVFFTREKEKQMKSGVQYILGKGLEGEVNWTEQIYDILEKLQMIEEQDEEEYRDHLYLTKLARAINRGDREEAERIKQKMEKRAKEKEEENQKGMEIE